MTWAAVKKALPQAKALAWDGCHKIYLALDDEQVALFRSYGYGVDNDGSVLILRDEASPLFTDPATPGMNVEKATNETLLATLHEWFADSCGLRFIEGVATDHEDPNAGFTRLIAQGERVRA